MVGLRKRLGTVLVLLLVVLFTAAAKKRRPATPEIDVDLALRTFDRAWSLIHETHFDPGFNGVDWEALRDELRPRVEQVKTEEELRSIIRDMLSRLEQSHFALLPRDAVDVGHDLVEPERKRKKKRKDKRRSAGSGEHADVVDPGEEWKSRPGGCGFQFRLIDDKVFVTELDEGGPAQRAGVQPGWMLTTVDEREIDALRERLQGMQMLEGLDSVLHAALTHRLSGEIGSTVELTFLDGGDVVTRRELKRAPAPGESIQFGNLPPFVSIVRARELEAASLRVGLIHLNVWMVPLGADFDSAVDRFREHDGIIIDLRGNPGGVGGMVMGLSGHFFDERVSLGTFQTRTTKLQFMANPRRVNVSGERVTPYEGPVAILIDGLSASTSEVFAGGMQSLGRARIFGSRSAGMALPAMMQRLPNHDVLYHAFASFTTPDGQPVEGRGVIPDEEINLTRQDLLTGKDPVLDAAVSWIRSGSGVN